MKKCLILLFTIFLSFCAYAQKRPWIICSAYIDTPSEAIDYYQFYGCWYDGDEWSMGWMEYYADYSKTDEAPLISFNDPDSGSTRDRVLLLQKKDASTGRKKFYVGNYSSLTVGHNLICLEFDSGQDAVDTLLLWCYLKTIEESKGNDIHFIPWARDVWYDEDEFELIDEKYRMSVIHNSGAAFSIIKNSRGYYYCDCCNSIFYGLKSIELYGFHTSSIASSGCQNERVAGLRDSINTLNLTYSLYQ